MEKLNTGPSPDGEWLTAAGVAEVRGVSRQYVVRAIKTGRLRGQLWGRFYMVRRADAAAWEPAKPGRRRKDE